MFTFTENLKLKNMTLSQEIKNNPYLKVSNCMDERDCQSGINACFELEEKYGKSKMIDKIFVRLFDKQKIFENES